MNFSIKNLTAAGLGLLFASTTMVWADGGPAVSAGKNLLQPAGARAAALGEAMTAATDDVTAFAYNPSALATLTTAKLSFLYNRGLVDDTYGQAQLGLPLKKAAIGVNVGYYDGGALDLFDGVTKKKVRAQSDFLGSIGLGQNFGRFRLGASGKYISSELGERAKATAFAVDLGAGMNVSKRFQFGLAAQNLGGSLKYDVASEHLPQTFRAGVSYLLISKKAPTTLLLDAPYFYFEKELRPGVGLETNLGLLALRAGYHNRINLTEFSFGAGIQLGAATLDYAFALVEHLNSHHRISLGYRFAGASDKNTQVKTPNPVQFAQEANPIKF